MVFYVYEEPSCMMAKKPSTPKMKQPSYVEKAVKQKVHPYDRRVPAYRATPNRNMGPKMPKYCFIPALFPVPQFCFYDFLFGGRLILSFYW